MSNNNKKASEEDLSNKAQDLEAVRYRGFANHMAATGFDGDQVGALTRKYHAQLSSQRSQINNFVSSVKDQVHTVISG